MMNRLILFSLAVLALRAQTVSSVTFDGKGDSSARVIFNVSSTFDAMRVRYNTSDCTSGSGGTVQLNGTLDGYVLYGMTAQLSGLAPSTLYHVCPEVKLGGGSYSSGVEGTFTTLARTTTTPTAPTAVSTTYPAQGGTTHTLTGASDCSDSGGGLQHWLTNAVPGDTIIVPAGWVCSGAYTTPIAAEAKIFSPSDVRTSDSRLTLTAHGYSENQEVHFSTAGANSNCLPGMQLFPGATIFTGSNCDKASGWNKNNKYYVHSVDTDHVQILDAPSGSPVVPGAIAFTANAGADTVTLLPTPNFSGGYVTAAGFGVGVPANTVVQFVAASGSTLPTGISADTDYFLLSSYTGATSFAPAYTTQISLMSGGSAVPISSDCGGVGICYVVDQGSGTMYIAAAPTQNSDWIVVQTSGTLPPTGVRINSTDYPDSQLFKLRTPDYTTTAAISFGIMAHNWRFKGALFDFPANTDYLTTTDPRSPCIGPSTNQDNRFIVFDQVRVQGGTYPNRTGCRSGAGNMWWDGAYISVINSDLRGLTYWHPWFGGTGGVSDGGTTPTLASGSQITMNAGVAHLGVVTTTFTGTPALTINFTGGTSNTSGVAYIAMDGTVKVVAGSTGSTTGNCSVSGSIAPSGSLTCTFSTAASPAVPPDGATGRVSGLLLFTFTMASGTVTGVTVANRTPPGVLPAGEGAQAIICGNGPGPYLFSNNNFGGAGLTVHCDDSGGPMLPRHDYTVTQNTFEVLSSTMLITSMDSDGLWYGNRQPLEWKSGERILVSGNLFTGCYAQVNNIGACIIITPRAGGYVTDVDVSNNEFYGVSGGVTIVTPADTHGPVSKPAARQRYNNNLFTINAWTHYVPTEAQPNGVTFYGGNATEDVEISHNTDYNNTGQAPQFIHWTWAPAGGVNIHDNINFYTADGTAMIVGESVPSVCSGTDKALMDCLFTSGFPTDASYTFTKTVIIPSWTNSQAQTGIVAPPTTISNAFTGLVNCGTATNCVPTQATVALNIGVVDWACGAYGVCGTTARSNFALNNTSVYHNAGTGGTDIGVIFPTLEDALGRVNSISVTGINGTGATVNFHAPSTFGCTVDASTDMTFPIGMFTNYSNAGGSQSQTVNLTGLTGSTTYYYRINCPATQPINTFDTVSGSPGSKLSGARLSGPTVIH